MSPVIAFHAQEPAAGPRETLSGDWDICAWSETLTSYDKRHIGLFSRLLCDEADGATELEIARDVFGLDSWFTSQRTRLIVRSHMRRARWIADNVFPILDL